MSHDNNTLALLGLRELSSQSIQSLSYIIILSLLTLPIHQWSAQGHLLEILLVAIEYAQIIIILHTRNNIQGSQSNTGIALSLQLIQSLLRSWEGNALVSLYAINDNMGGISSNYLYTRMCSLDTLNSCINGLSTGVSEGGAEGHNNDGIFVSQVLQSRVLIGTYTHLRSSQQSRSSSLYLWVQLISSLGRSYIGRENGTNCNSSYKKFFPVLHKRNPP